MFMNPSFWIVPAFKKSRERSSHLGAGRQNERGKVVLALPTQLYGTEFFASILQIEARGGVKEGQYVDHNTGDVGGSQSDEFTTSPFNAAPAAKQNEFKSVENTAFGIEAMRNGYECEAYK